MKVLVTGAHGLLGRSLVEAADKSVDILTCGRRDEPVGGSYSKLDLSDPVALNHFLAKKKPDWVIHTAAWTDVDGCEGNPSMARRTNLDLVQNLVEISSSLAALSPEETAGRWFNPFFEYVLGIRCGSAGVKGPH